MDPPTRGSTCPSDTPQTPRYEEQSNPVQKDVLKERPTAIVQNSLKEVQIGSDAREFLVVSPIEHDETTCRDNADASHDVKVLVNADVQRRSP